MRRTLAAALALWIGLGDSAQAAVRWTPGRVARPGVSAPLAIKPSSLASGPKALGAVLVPPAAAPLASAAPAPAALLAPAAADHKPAAPAATTAEGVRAQALVTEQTADWDDGRGEGPGPAPNRSRAAKLALVGGGVLVGAASLATMAPGLLTLAAAKPAAVLGGYGLLAVSRLLKAPSKAAEVSAPPAPQRYSFVSLWKTAGWHADAQKALGARAGGSSWASVRDWALGAARASVSGLGVAIGGMAAGAALGKAIELARPALSIPYALIDAARSAIFTVGGSSGADGGAGLAMETFSSHIGPYIVPEMLRETAALGVFFGVDAAARKLGAGRASPWIAGAAALGIAAIPALALAPTVGVLASMVGLEAGILWLAARSRSWVAPLLVRLAFSVIAVETVRLNGLLAAVGGALVGLPPVWGGLAVAGMIILAVRVGSPAARLSEFKRWWTAPEPGGRPKSPLPVIGVGLFWGAVVYATGDLLYWAVNAVSPSHEPPPDVLVKMLSGGADLVLYNFAFVALLEEWLFRRGLFKSLSDRLDKAKRLSPKARFWTAAVVSSLIFSGVHYVDWGAMLAELGVVSPGAASGVTGAYAFTWAGFLARSALGVLLAGLYAASGTLVVPIVAHFWADSMEGLGLRFGLEGFLALAAAGLALSFLRRPAAPAPEKR